MSDAWDAWFSVQYDLCQTIQQAIRDATSNRPASYRAALYSALIEDLAEKLRFDLELPEDQQS